MENINLIRKIAWSFSTTTGVEFEDLFQEACLAYLEALRTYDPQKGSITTWLWHCTQNRLKNYVKLEIEEKEHICPLEEARNFTTSYEPFWENLNKEAHEIMKVILSQPLKFGNLSSFEAQKQIVLFLLKKGWDSIKIYSGMKNLKSVFANS